MRESYEPGVSVILWSQSISRLDCQGPFVSANIWGYAELRIHEEIERGNNESIKQGTNLAAAATGSCGGL